jgi:hypothetical protein
MAESLAFTAALIALFGCFAGFATVVPFILAHLAFAPARILAIVAGLIFRLGAAIALC